MRRDEWGTPHISAVDANDALFVLGYETARDRMFQLDLLRRRTLGRTAELLGESAAADDRIARTELPEVTGVSEAETMASRQASRTSRELW